MKRNGFAIVPAAMSALIYFGGANRAEALPTFARQMSMPCSACHYEEFPVLKKFGMNFKASGYSMIGDQAKVEDEGLSIPSVLNASIMLRAGAQKTNGQDGGFNTANSYAYDQAAGQANGTELGKYLATKGLDPYTAANPPNPTATTSSTNKAFGTRAPFDSQKNRTTNAGELQFPSDLAVFYGGRISENVGVLLEVGLTSPAGATNIKMPVWKDLGDYKVGFIPFFTDGVGPAAGFELLSTGAAQNIVAGEFMAQYTAQQFIGTGIAATGGSFVLHHDLFFAAVTPYTPEGAGNHASPSNIYSRIAFTPSIGDFDFGFGFANFGGQQTVVTDAFDQSRSQRSLPKAQALDAQVQGTIGVPIGIYASIARAPATETRWAVSPAGVPLPSGQGTWSGTSPLDPGIGTVGGFDTGSMYTIAAPMSPEFNLVRAPAVTNTFNSQLRDKRAASIVVTVSVVPNRVILIAGYMKGDNGQPTGGQRADIDVYNLVDPKTGNAVLQNIPTHGQNIQNALTLGVHYKMFQNVNIKLEQTRFSGSYYTKDGVQGIDTITAGTNPPSTGVGTYKFTNLAGPWSPGGTGNQVTTLVVHAAF